MRVERSRLRPVNGGHQGEREALPHMSLDSLTGPEAVGSVPASGGRVRRSVGVGLDLPKRPPSARRTEQSAGLRSALAAVRDDLRFETASLFVPARSSWKLLEREGPVRRWHSVLDPGALEGSGEAAEYPDARDIPGIGPRLAALGCASVAVLPLPDGGRILLDSTRPCGNAGWIERSRPYLELIGLLSGPSLPVAAALRTQDEVVAVGRLIEACREALTDPDATAVDIVASAQESLGAEELFLIVEQDGEIEVVGAPIAPLRRLPKETRTQILRQPGPGLPQAVVRKLAAWVGATSRSLVGAVGREGEETDVLLAGWGDGPSLSPASMTVAARSLSMAAAALQQRRQAVASLVNQERSRLAYALHDGVTQSVTGAVLELEALAQRIERDPAEALAVLETCKLEMRQALAELREMLFDLSRDGEGEQNGPLTESITDVARRWRLPARVAVEGDLSTVPGPVLSVAYVVIREALTNAAKHAASNNVTVSLSAGVDDLTVIVGDGGKGFTRRDVMAAREAKHVGLAMLRRRVAEIGGRLQVESRPGKGTRVIAELPLRRTAS
jgi:signal transduction histidine kinase